MSDPMQRVLKGVVRDHRLPRDYTYKYVQPWHTGTFLRGVKRFLVHRQITKQNVTIPIYTMLMIVPLYSMFYIYTNYKMTGYWPQAL